MATKKASVTLRGDVFPAGTKVGLYRRVGDYFSPAGLGKVVKTATVSKHNEVTFKSLEEGDPFWAAARVRREWRYRKVTAKVPPAPKPRQAAPVASVEASQTQPETPREIVTGARGTANTRVRGHQKPEAPFANPAVGKPSESTEIEPLPHARLEDQDQKTKLRSDTVTGEAHPVDPDEPQPGLKQEDVPKGTKQRSDTELGTATIIPPGEGQPAVRQEDVKSGVKQRSATETGSAEPLPEDAQGRRKTKRSPSRKKAARARKSQNRAKKAASTSKQKATAKKKAARQKRGKK